MSKQYRIGASMANQDGIMTLRAFQAVVTETFEDWLFEHHIEVPEMIRQYGMAWIFLGMSIEMEKMPLAGTNLTVEMSSGSRNGRIFRYDVTGRAGEKKVFQAAVFSTLLKLDTRRMVAETEIPAICCSEFGEPGIIAGSLPEPMNLVMENGGQRRIYPSWMDELGHINNSHYGELAYDALSPEGRHRISNARRIEIYFQHEIVCGEMLQLEKAETAECLQIQGIKSDGRCAFDYRIFLGE